MGTVAIIIIGILFVAVVALLIVNHFLNDTLDDVLRDWKETLESYKKFVEMYEEQLEDLKKFRSIMYLCDMKACGDGCPNSLCMYTNKIEHAASFERCEFPGGSVYYREKEREEKKVEPNAED